MFKEMAAVMSDSEVQRCMDILIEGSVIIEINRDYIQNAIDVTFRIIGDVTQQPYSMSLLSDSVQDIPKGIPLRIDGEYLYIQYLVAKGYSEYWKGNMFVNEDYNKDIKTIE